jgi:hypothetical protein
MRSWQRDDTPRDQTVREISDLAEIKLSGPWGGWNHQFPMIKEMLI